MDTTYKNPNENFFTQNITAPISTSTLTSNEQPLNLPPQPQDTTNYAGITTSIPTFDSLLGQTQQEQPAEKTASTLMERLLGTSSKLGQKGVRQGQVEQSLGLPQFQTQLTDINNQLQSLQKEALAIPLQLQEQVQGRGVTAGGLQPIQTGQLRQNAIKSLTLSAIGQTLQGNIANAQAQANRAVDLEFQPLEAELNTLKLAYDMNKDILERQDKKKANALNLQIAERTRLLEEGKADKKTVLGFVAEASKNGAPTLLVQRASELNDPAQALSLLSQYMSDPVAKEKALVDIALTRANIRKINADISKTQAEKEKILAETTTNTVNAKQQLQNNEALTLAKELRGEAKGKAGAVGFGLQKLVPFGQSLGLQGARTGFEAKVNTLKSNLTLDNLKLLKGAMSDKDLLFLNSIGSSLDTNMSEEQFNNELDRVIKKLEDAGATSGVVSQTINVQGQNYTVGQTYQDASGKKWVVDAQGNWSEQ